MHYAACVCCVERSGNLGQDLRRALKTEPALPRNDRLECVTLEPFHDDVRDVIRRLSCVFDVNNVFVVELTGSPGFTLKERQSVGMADCEVGKEDLERNAPVDLQVASAIHGAHSADANEGFNLIFVEKSLPNQMKRVLE